MPGSKISAAYDALKSVTEKDVYISHKLASDEISRTQDSLPTGLSEKLRTYLNPLSLYQLLKLKRLISDFETHRQTNNELFIERELSRRSQLFDDIGGFPLDQQQRKAVVADEDNSLVIAGAGSGKTLTIVGKVRYLLEALGVEADSILPISFTNKSARSLEEKINISGIKPQTFHAFGLTVLQSVENRRPKIFEGNDNKKLFRSFIQYLSKDPAYLTLLNSFFLNYIKVPKSQFEFESLGDYIQYLKDQNFNTYKKIKIPYQGRETYKNETVKSIEECIIANFLIFNRVEYVYEQQYEYPYSQFGRKKSYKPDFTITTDDVKVYLEHLGMDRNGNVPVFFAGPKESHYEATRRYARMLEWKRRVHQQNRTKLIESYSYQSTEGTLLDELKANLISAGVKLNPMTDDEVWQVIQDSGKDQVDAFVDLVQTFLALLKSNGYSVQGARDINEEREANPFLKERARLFLDLFEPIFNLYEDNLRQNGEIDFNDMITRATQYIEDGDYYCPLKYVIVDEFQDLSFGRYRILQAVRKQNPDVKFYCVGDDWQSIYRFTGSDIALFRDFEQHFGYTYKARIETTYRFNDPLITMSSEFILKNPNQSPKSLRAPEGTPPTTHTIIESEGGDDDTQALIDALNGLTEHGLTPEKEVYVIGRYTFDVQRIKNSGRQFIVNYTTGLIKYTFQTGKFKGETLVLKFITAHKSKGLEADYAIVINCNSGKYGFPSGKADDPVLNLLLSSADQFENGEERRLFYVAMTRTKRHVVFITDKYRKSKFIKELQDEHDSRHAGCPKCHNGDLILRSGKSYKFYGCSNFAYGCSYTQSDAPSGTEEPRPVQRAAASINMPAAKPVKESIKPTSRPSLSVAPRVQDRHTAPSVEKSLLTKSESNRFSAFIARPELYAGTQKAKDKVTGLQMISHKLSPEQKDQFDTALDKWKMQLKSHHTAKDLQGQTLQTSIKKEAR